MEKVLKGKQQNCTSEETINKQSWKKMHANTPAWELHVSIVFVSILAFGQAEIEEIVKSK